MHHLCLQACSLLCSPTPHLNLRAACAGAIVDAVECPDGGIGWQGVLMTGKIDDYCAAWDSQAAQLGLQICRLDRKTCTKLGAMHLHMMTQSAGVLVMKRMKCHDEGCSVFKVKMPCRTMTIQRVMHPSRAAV